MLVLEQGLLQELRLVQQKYRVNALSRLVLDVGGDAAEDGARIGGDGDTESVAQVAVEVAPTEGDVVAIGQAKAGLRQSLPQGPQHARLADAGVTDEATAGAFLDGLDQLVDEALLAGRQPQVGVLDFLAEGREPQSEVLEMAAHESPSFRVGLRPTAFSRSDRLGSKSVSRARARRKQAEQQPAKTKRFARKDFIYDEAPALCICPAGHRLYRSGRDMLFNGYRLAHFKAPITKCRGCPLRAQCLRPSPHGHRGAGLREPAEQGNPTFHAARLDEGQRAVAALRDGAKHREDRRSEAVELSPRAAGNAACPTRARHAEPISD